MQSNIVDVNSSTANMYGCEPCPQCGGIFRYVVANQITCDDCGHKEQAAECPTCHGRDKFCKICNGLAPFEPENFSGDEDSY